MNFKYIFLLSVSILSLEIQAKEVDLNSFCKQTEKLQEASKSALENDGKILVRSKKNGNKISKLEVKYYRGCRYDVNWLRDIYEASCKNGEARDIISIKQNLKDIFIPQHFIFLFDGAGDFNASLAKYSINPVNIDGSEGSELGLGNANGLSLFQKLYDHFEVVDDEIEIHYHTSSGLHMRENFTSALECAKQIKENLEFVKYVDKSYSKNHHWITLGYSNGGAGVIDFQNKVSGLDIKVDLAITVDPIIQTLFYPFHKVKKVIGKRNPYTKRFVNLFQTSDHGSLPLLKLRGKPVLNADVNYNLSEDQKILSRGELSPSGNYDHIRIVHSNTVVNLAVCELNKVLKFTDETISDC